MQHSRKSEIVVAPFVEGALIESMSDTTMDVINPSTGERFLSVPAGCQADADRAVVSARVAFDDGRWSEAPPSQRKRVLHQLADLIATKGRLLDELDAIEMGKPISETFGNAMAAADLMRFYAEAVDKITGDVYVSDKRSFVVQRRVPRGVIAAIVPWNFPTYVASLKIAPALAAGNCVVLKPSELSSRSAILLAQLAVDAGVPPGVLNVVPGLGQTVGQSLGLHPHVDMLTFTGSTAIGQRMLQYAGQSNMKVVMAECGGKSPQIVFADTSNLQAAADSIAQFLLTNQGQICSVGSRVLVQRSVEPLLIELLAAAVDRVVIGDASHPKTTFGPLASAKQCARVMEYVESARRDEAELVMGGMRVLQESGGYFVAPTVFRNVSSQSRIAKEEIFGPVLAVTPFDDEVDAIRIANDNAYGLAAYVWTTDLSTAMRVAKAIRSSVTINAVAPCGEGAGHAASSEPTGASGIGSEGGLPGMEGYLRRQFVGFNHA